MDTKKEVTVTKAIYGDHPIVFDEYGVERFEKDPVIEYLYKRDKIDLNQISIDRQTGVISHETERRILRGLGYSVSGYEDLNINSIESLIKELGFDVILDYYGKDDILNYFDNCEEELIELIGQENYDKMFIEV